MAGIWQGLGNLTPTLHVGIGNWIWKWQWKFKSTVSDSRWHTCQESLWFSKDSFIPTLASVNWDSVPKSATYPTTLPQYAASSAGLLPQSSLTCPRAAKSTSLSSLKFKVDVEVSNTHICSTTTCWTIFVGLWQSGSVSVQLLPQLLLQQQTNKQFCWYQMPFIQNPKTWWKMHSCFAPSPELPLPIIPRGSWVVMIFDFDDHSSNFATSPWHAISSSASVRDILSSKVIIKSSFPWGLESLLST